MRERLDIPSRLNERQARLAGYACLVRVMTNLGEWLAADMVNDVDNPFVNRYRAICRDFAIGKASSIEFDLDGPDPNTDLVVATKRLGLVRSNSKLDGHARRALQDLSGIRKINISPIPAAILSNLTDYYTETTIRAIIQRESIGYGDLDVSGELELVAGIQGEAAYYIKSD